MNSLNPESMSVWVYFLTVHDILMYHMAAHKYIFIIGGVMSGVGKGIATSAIGKILQGRGFTVNLVKADPYLNVDAGNMNPTEHGEVFILENGLETDQDMGNYERFLNRSAKPEDYMTSGMVYQTVIEKERALAYGGKCVEAIPHVRDEIIKRFERAASVNQSDISVIEIGGTVGDYQNMMFIEAARVMWARNKRDVVFVLVSYLPVPGSIGEMKTKPTQNAIRQLNAHGVQPDIIIARSPVAIDDRRKEKIAYSCTIKPENVISAPDIKSVYDVPLNFERDHLSDVLLSELSLEPKQASDLSDWAEFAKKAHNGHTEISIAVVGKYFDSGDFVLSDAYISVIEAIKYSCYAEGVKPKFEWIDSKEFETGEKDISYLAQFKGIVVPGGFGTTGIDGILMAVQYARENKIPYLGLCYGMQLLTIEFARNVAGLAGAHTVEVQPDSLHPVIDIMPEQKQLVKEGKYGGTMRLGNYTAELAQGSIAAEVYRDTQATGRHRHRYEVNPTYIAQLEKAGLIFSGKSKDGRLMEIAELPRDVHPYMLGTQYHPELTARPLDPEPVFTGFVKAILRG
jgi:CTP synthase